MSWRVTAVWLEPARAGLYSRDGGEPIVVAVPCKVFAELDDAKALRARILQAHSDATVNLGPHVQRSGPTDADGDNEASQRRIARPRHQTNDSQRFESRTLWGASSRW